jgi:HK97 gp10 family phage protein
VTDLAHVKGLSDIQKRLDTLPPKIERTALRGGLRAGAGVIRDAARANIESESGELAASLKTKSNAKGGKVTATVYTRVFYAKFVEFGTKPHMITARGAQGLSFGGRFVESVEHPGARPHPFLRPAMDAYAGAAVVAAGEYLKKRLATKHGLDTADIVIEEEPEA